MDKYINDYDADQRTADMFPLMTVDGLRGDPLMGQPGRQLDRLTPIPPVQIFEGGRIIEYGSIAPSARVRLADIKSAVDNCRVTGGYQDVPFGEDPSGGTALAQITAAQLIPGATEAQVFGLDFAVSVNENVSEAAALFKLTIVMTTLGGATVTTGPMTIRADANKKVPGVSFHGRCYSFYKNDDGETWAQVTKATIAGAAFSVSVQGFSTAGRLTVVVLGPRSPIAEQIMQRTK